MKNAKKYFYQVNLEVFLKKADFVFGFINISHISYEKLFELLGNKITDERFLFDDARSYEISEDLYNENKDFFDNEIPFTFDFSLFDYAVGLTGDPIEKYEKDYYDEWPPLKISYS